MSRVQSTMTRMKPAPRGSPGVWPVGSGRVNRLLKSRGSGRVGSGGFQNLMRRVGSGRVGSRGFNNLSGRLGLGQDVSKFSRAEQLTRPDPTREKLLIFITFLRFAGRSNLKLPYNFMTNCSETKRRKGETGVSHCLCIDRSGEFIYS